MTMGAMKSTIPSAGRSDQPADRFEWTAASVARTLLPARETLCREILRTVAREVPELADDARLHGLLTDVVRENLHSATQALAEDAPMELVGAPPVALEHAVVLAQRRVPITVLLRAYRLGQSCFLESTFNTLHEMDADTGRAVMDVVRRIATYIDRVSELVEQAYNHERALRVGSTAAVSQRWVNELLTGRAPDIARAEATLRYRLRGWHLALELWAQPDLDGASVTSHFVKLGRLLQHSPGLSGHHLLVPTDTHSARLWLPVSEDFELPAEQVARMIDEGGIPAHVAIGDAREGIAGFRTSAHTAGRVKRLATSVRPEPAVLSYESMAPLTLLTDDEEEIGTFVEATLGDLAGPGTRNEGLRETLLVYLESNKSFHLAAKELHVHRNTIHYRVHQAIDVLGRDIPADTMRLQLALMVCRWRPAGAHGARTIS